MLHSLLRHYSHHSAIMKLMVFGGTGQTGSAVLKLAVAQEDLEISAFVRTPSKIPDDVQAKLQNIVTGDVLNYADVSKSLVGQDAVISCLGTPLIGGLPKLMSRGIEHVVKGMQENGVKKLALVGSAAFLAGEASFINKYLIQKLAADHGRAINFLQTVNDVEWTVAMAPFIKQAAQVGDYKTAIDKLPGTSKATTYDLAHWMLAYVQNDDITKENVYKLVGISSQIS